MRKWIDGVSDLYKARNNKFRFSIWFIVMASMLGLCSYSISNTVKGFINSPTVIILTTVPNVSMEMPDILLCYKGGFNAYKMKYQMGLPDKLIKNLAHEFSQILLLENFRDDHIVFNNYLTENQMNVEQFFQDISFKYEDVIIERHRAGLLANHDNRCDNVSQKLVEYYMPGSCLLLRDNGEQKWPGVTGGVKLRLKEPNGSHHQMYPKLAASGFDLDISRRYNRPNLKLVKLPSNIAATINAKATLHKRLRNCDSNRDEERSSSNDCYMRCYKDILESFCQCIFAADRTLENETICSIYEFKTCWGLKNGAIANDLHSCTQRCLPNCIEWEYDFTTSITNAVADANESQTKITIAFNRFQFTKDEEIQSLTFDMAIGNVGGIAGLYLGCSMITIFQLIYYLILQSTYFVKKMMQSNLLASNRLANDVWAVKSKYPNSRQFSKIYIFTENESVTMQC